MKRIALLLFAIILSLLVACGGGSSSSSSSSTPGVPQLITLSGTAATGAPIQVATVELKDANGVIVTTTTDSDGKYSINAELTLPVLLRVTTGGKQYYSVATQEGITNIHPFTDLIVRNWYEVQNVNVDEAFQNPGALPAPPTDQEIKTTEAVVKLVVSDVLLAAGIIPSEFSLLNSEFDANGEGFDKVLDVVDVNVDENTGNMTVSVGSTTLVSTDDVTEIATIKNEIQSRFANFIQNGKIDNDDYYYQNEFLFYGLSIDGFRSAITDNGITEIEFVDIINYNKNEQKVRAKGIMELDNGVKFLYDRFYFKKDGDSWKFLGNELEAVVQCRLSMWKVYINGNPQFQKKLEVDVDDDGNKGITKVTIDGPKLINSPCYLTQESSTEFDGEFWWEGNNPITMTGQPDIGDEYTINIYTTDPNNAAYTYNVTMLPLPDDLAYPDFKEVLPPQNLDFSSEQDEITFTGKVYIPPFVYFPEPPSMELWEGEVGNSNKIAEDLPCQFTSDNPNPQPNSVAWYSCTVPKEYEGQTFDYVQLESFAQTYEYGGVETAVSWNIPVNR